MPASILLRASAALSVLSGTAFAGTSYTIQDEYKGSTFLNGFDFYDGTDFTNGYVTYVNEKTAEDTKLVSSIDGRQYIGVDNSITYNPNGIGRRSVRIETAKTYNQGLFVLDLKHMPGNACGSWPAFWSVGDNWPIQGEIDIIEGVNLQAGNQMVLHTDTTCSVNGLGQTARQTRNDCALNGPSGPAGCDTFDQLGTSYGTPFNNNGGGVYAMEWTDNAIKIWFFPRGDSRLTAVTAEHPDTSFFGVPTVNFQGACDIKKRFQDHRFIFDTTFCGEWAGSVYGDSGCPQYSGLTPMQSCKKYVAENPSVFSESYWLINYFKTYTKSTSVSSSSSVVSSTALSTRSTASSSPVSSSVPSTSSAAIASTTSISSQTPFANTSSSPIVGTATPSSGFGIHNNSSSPIYLNTTGTGSLPRPTVSSPYMIPSGIASASGPGIPSNATGTGYHMPALSSPAVHGVQTRSLHTYGNGYTIATPAPYASIHQKGYQVDKESNADKATLTTTYTTAYVDVCSTGYTTKTATQTVTYATNAAATGSSVLDAEDCGELAPGMTITTKVCTACGPTPVIVALTVPYTPTGVVEYSAGHISTENDEMSIVSEEVENAVASKPTSSDYTSNVTSSNVPNGVSNGGPEVEQPAVTPIVPYPSAAPSASGPAPVTGSNGTLVYGTATAASIAKTSATQALSAEYFLGAASNVRAGALMAVGAVVIAALLM